mmetsp:Transcript_27195/g.56646  ORF Transcript_27195/g.56646 Transcript_27195/m.56646 type:complete len:186 (+) Transcript_27195:211-768(+)
MATFLLNAHNIISACCGPAGNIFAKIFQTLDDKDEASPAAYGATTLGGKKFGFTDKQAKYMDVPWSKLPLSARKAAKAIGYEQASWDHKEWLPIDDNDWWDLSTEEKAACERLGWDSQSWDDKYEHTSWADMPNHVQKAAGKLGWSQEQWDDDWDVPSWHKGWGEFTKEEQRCLHVMGYFIHSWD